MKKERAAPLQTQACLFSAPFSAVPVAAGWFVGVRCCSPGVCGAGGPLFSAPDITTRVWGANLFQAGRLAAGTQVTSPPCKVCDSHLTLLSRKRTRCLRTERGKWSFSALRIPHPPHTEPFIFACVPHIQSYLWTCGGCKELIYYLFSFNDLCPSPLGTPIRTMQIVLSPWQ